jgi:hypothetical protein
VGSFLTLIGGTRRGNISPGASDSLSCFLLLSLGAFDTQSLSRGGAFAKNISTL